MIDLYVTITGVLSTADLENLLSEHSGLSLSNVSLPYTGLTATSEEDNTPNL